MQVHELDPFIGEISEDTVLAIDDGTETMQIPATDLGVTTEMTVAEITAGTGTEPRVITPAVAKALKALVLTYDTDFSSLPLTITDSRITTDMCASKLILSNPSAMTSDWNFNTDTAGQVTITGSINGSTQIQELWLEATQ